MLQKEIELKLAQYRDPYLDKDLVTMKAIKRLTIGQDLIELDVVFGYPIGGIKQKITSDLQTLLAGTAQKIKINVSSHIEAHGGNQQALGLPNVKNMLAVASGKGGVGKSTIAINLALALAQEGAVVGLLDADIYGPSQPTMLGTAGKRPEVNGKLFSPIKQHGIQSMSIGYLIDPTTPMVWRGPMIGKAMQQLLYDTQWEALDYLIIDLPPGTGDIQLTLCQKMPVSGAVIVTTPQDLALLDVARACEMFNKLNVPILGIIENMSAYHCPQCGHQEKIFGAGGGAKLAEQYAAAFLGKLPLAISIREMTDSGNPPVVQAPDSGIAQAFKEIARHTAAKLALQKKDYSTCFPKIVVESNK